MDIITIPEESFEDETHRESKEAIDRMKRDRLDDYSYSPSNAILGGIKRSLNRKLED